jgi:glycosyltransferase involved in cell wall biosynthesis
MPEPTSVAVRSRPLLTIAIPTFNRAANLALLLRMLKPEVVAFPEIELLISDNASSDDTESLVRQFLQDGLRCRYIRNAENIDADPNFLQCYQQASGKYLWIFGDDDVIFPGALASLVRLLATEECDLIYLTPFGFLREPNERRLANSQPNVFAFTDPRAFVHAVGLRGDVVMLSAVIVNKDSVEKHPHPDFAEGRNTNLLQLGWTFTALRHMRRAFIFERGLYAVCEFNPQRRFDVIRVFGVNWSAATDRHFERGSPLHTALLNDQLYSWFPTHWYGMRRKPDHTIIRDPVGQMRPIYRRFPLFWLCTYPLLVWPMLPAGAWLALWRTIRKIDLWLNRRVSSAIAAL